MLSFFLEYDIYLEKVFTLNSMADSLECIEIKQPQVGKKPQRMDYSWCLVQVTAHRDLESTEDQRLFLASEL